MDKLPFLLLFLGPFVVACNSLPGCTDPDAINYEEWADTFDGSCEYEGRVVFWYGETVASLLVGAGISSLTYRVDGEVVGSAASDIFWTGAPDCGQDGSVTATRSLGNSTIMNSPFEVTDNFGDVIWQGTIEFGANLCIQQELVE